MAQAAAHGVDRQAERVDQHRRGEVVVVAQQQHGALLGGQAVEAVEQTASRGAPQGGIVERRIAGDAAIGRIGPVVEIRTLVSAGAFVDGIDVGIRFGRGNYPGMVVERLMGDVYYPVASPRYRGGELPSEPGQLPRHTLLRSVEPWSPWLRAAGLEMAEPSGGVMFEDLSMLIRSAADGNGVALVRHVVAMQEIASGQLVRLFDIATPCPDEYFFVAPAGLAGKPQVVAFRNWLLEEIAAFQRQQIGLT